MEKRKRFKLTIDRICEICQETLPAGMTAYEVISSSGKVTYEHYGKCKGVQRQDDVIKQSNRIKTLEKCIESLLIAIEQQDPYCDGNLIVGRLEKIGEQSRWYSGEDLMSWATDQASRALKDGRS